MSELDVIFKALLGGLVIGLIVLINNHLGPKAAAILSFAPVFTVLGLLLVTQAEQNNSSNAAQEYIIGLFISAPAMIACCLVIYFMIKKYSLLISVIAGLTVWLGITATYLVLLN